MCSVWSLGGHIALQYDPSRSRACQGPMDEFPVLRKGCGALEMGIPVGLSVSRLCVDGSYFLCRPLTGRALQACGPQSWRRACLFSCSLSLTGLWVPDSKLEVPLQGSKECRVPVPFWASCCPSLCCTTAMLGAARKTEKHKYHRISRLPVPFPGLSGAQLRP